MLTKNKGDERSMVQHLSDLLSENDIKDKRYLMRFMWKVANSGY